MFILMHQIHIIAFHIYPDSFLEIKCIVNLVTAETQDDLKTLVGKPRPIDRRLDSDLFLLQSYF